MPLPTDVTATLLYDRYRPIAAETILAEINEIMGPAGLYFSETEPKSGWDARFEDGAVSVSLRFSSKPEPRHRFQAAIDSPFAKLNFEDWGAVVGAHRQAIVVQAEADGAANRDTFELLLTLGQITTNHLIVHHTPEAIHWGQSDQFFEPEAFLLMADVLFPLPIFLHPKPFSSGRVAEGTQAMGFHLEGSEEILGRHVIFAEAPARIHYLLERAFAFVDHCRENGVILGDGAAFGMMVGETIQVTHMGPTHDCPRGAVVLTLRERDGVFQLQPEGAPPSREGVTLAEADASGAQAMNTNPNQAPATSGAPRSAGNTIDDFFTSPDAKTSQRLSGAATAQMTAEDGAARLREASRERLMEEQISSNRRVANTQMIGSMIMGGPAVGRLSPELQPYIVWFSIVFTALVHPPAAVVLGLTQFFAKPPYYVMLGVISIIFFGAVLTGTDPALGYFDVLGINGAMGGFDLLGIETSGFFETGF